MKYDLARMLAEIARDERAGRSAESRVLTQEQIKALARGRRNRRTDSTAPAK